MAEIIIAPVLGAEYSFALRVCLLGRGLVSRGDIRIMATVLIHETTHGWLYAKGIRWSEDRHQRVEAICLREELRFARRLADGRLQMAVLRRLNELPQREDELQERARSIGALGMPRWFTRLWMYANRGGP